MTGRWSRDVTSLGKMRFILCSERADQAIFPQVKIVFQNETEQNLQIIDVPLFGILYLS